MLVTNQAAYSKVAYQIQTFLYHRGFISDTQTEHVFPIGSLSCHYYTSSCHHKPPMHGQPEVTQLHIEACPGILVLWLLQRPDDFLGSEL